MRLEGAPKQRPPKRRDDAFPCGSAPFEKAPPQNHPTRPRRVGRARASLAARDADKQNKELHSELGKIKRQNAKLREEVDAERNRRQKAEAELEVAEQREADSRSKLNRSSMALVEAQQLAALGGAAGRGCI